MHDQEFQAAPANQREPHLPVKMVDADTASRAIRAAVTELVNGPHGRVAVINVTMGAGKSMETRELASTSLGSWMFFLPTHALAAQHYHALDKLGAGQITQHRHGITSLRLGDSFACARHKDATALVVAGIDPLKRLCPGCPCKDTHPATGGTCPAFENANPVTSGRIRLLQQTKMHEILAARGRAYANAETYPAEVVVVDEPPPLVQTLTFRRSDIRVLRQWPTYLQPAVAEKVRAVAEYLSFHLQHGVPSGATFSEILLRDTATILRETVDFTLAAAHEEVAARRLGSIVTDIARAREIMEKLREAAWLPDRKCIFSGADGTMRLVTRAPWVRQLARWIHLGGKALILDATANRADYRSLLLPRKDWEAIAYHEIHVADAPGVKRIYYGWGSGPRSRHLVGSTPKWGEFQSVLRHLAGLTKEHGAPVGIITDKPTALALQALLNGIKYGEADAADVLPLEFVEVVRSGVEFRVGWYGAHRGLDHWADCRIHATVGDPFPNVGDAQAEALLLGRDERAHAHARCLAEIVQASGRARPIHRKDSVLIVHYGKTAPSLWLAPQWAGAEHIAAKNGRPKKKLAGGAVDDTELLRRHGQGISIRELARQTGVGASTIGDRLREARSAATPLTSSQVRARPPTSPEIAADGNHHDAQRAGMAAHQAQQEAR